MGKLLTKAMGNYLTTLMGNLLTEPMGKLLDIYTRKGLGDYFGFYNTERPHASLAGKTPFEVYYGVSTARDAGIGQRI